MRFKIDPMSHPFLLQTHEPPTEKSSGINSYTGTFEKGQRSQLYDGPGNFTYFALIEEVFFSKSFFDFCTTGKKQPDKLTCNLIPINGDFYSFKKKFETDEPVVDTQERKPKVMTVCQ